MGEVWEQATLRDVCQDDGTIQTGPFGSQLHAEDYVAAGVPVVMPVNIGDGRVSEHAIARITEENAHRLSRHRMRVGDIVYSRRGDITRRALITMTEEGWLCGTGCLLVRPGTDIDSKWLSYWLGAPWTHEFLRQRAVGATMPNLNTSILSEVPVSVPSLPEQRAIAGVLGGLDDLIDTNQRLISQIRRLSSGWFEALAEHAPGVASLGDVAQVNPEQTKPRSEGELTYLDIAGVGDGSLSFPEPMPWITAPSRARRLASHGDTLWSTVRPNRRAHALLLDPPSDLVVSTGLAVLHPTDIGAATLFAATDRQEFVDFLMSRADGSAYPAVRGNAFLDAPLPDVREIANDFEATMWTLWQWAGMLSTEVSQLRRTREELLPLLMTGAVSVGEVAA